MVARNKSFGKSTLAGLFAVAAMASAVPAFASTTTVTWDFFGGTGANSDIGTTATFTGTEDPLGSLLPPLSNELSITASGYVVKTTVKYDYSNKKRTTSYADDTQYDLYNKNLGGAENGLGLITANYPSGTHDNGMVDGEISDTTKAYVDSDNNKQDKKGKGGENNGRDTESGSYTYGTGMIQLDLSNLLSFATGSGAYLKIGSLSTSSKDVAVFSGTNSAGQFGTVVGNPLSYTTSGVGSETLSLSDLTDPSTHQYYSYLNISVAKPGQSVLLSTLSLTFNTNSGGPSAAPVPATAGLTLAGALGMGMLLLARRRRSML